MIALSRNFFLGITLSGMLTGCTGFQQWIKPQVNGLSVSPQFTSEALVEGGISTVSVENLSSAKPIQLASLQRLLEASIREGRKDIAIEAGGLYAVKAEVLSDEVSQRIDNGGNINNNEYAENDDNKIYKYSVRTVNVNYIVSEANTGQSMWQGSITTTNEAVASYKKTKFKSGTEEAATALFEAALGTDANPYPQAPQFSSLIQQNFGGFVMNLPIPKKT